MFKVYHLQRLVFRYKNFNLLNQARAGMWPPCAGFLKIVSVLTSVCVCICVCVCVSTSEAINN